MPEIIYLNIGKQVNRFMRRLPHVKFVQMLLTGLSKVEGNGYTYYPIKLDSTTDLSKYKVKLVKARRQFKNLFLCSSPER